MVSRKLLQFILACVVIGCSGVSQNDEIPPVLNTLTTTSTLINTNLEEVVFTSTVSHTPQPTQTTLPNSPTPVPFSLTENAIIAACNGTERFWYTKHLSAQYYVNEQWGAVICSDIGIYTKVINESLNVVWKIPSVEGSPDTSEPSWYWKPLLWSPNGKYLYLEAICLCFIDSPWLIYADGFGLSRLDLFSGQFDVWLKPSDNPWYNFVFSDDTRFFAFTPTGLYQVVKIRDLMTGEEKSISLKEKYNVLKYQWTPDNSRLVIFAEEHAEDPLEAAFVIFVYSLKDETLIKIAGIKKKEILASTDPYDSPRILISNLTNDVLELSDLYSEEKFQVNLRSGEFISLTKLATSTP